MGNHNIFIDTGPSSRRAFLYRALQSRDLSPEDIDIIILTHMHSGKDGGLIQRADGHQQYRRR